MQKSSITFCLAMFFLAATLTYIQLLKISSVNFSLILNVIISALIFAVPSSIAFYFGIKKVGVVPTISKIIMAVLFAYFIGNSTMLVFNLREVSWFLFPLTVAVLSYLAPLRLLKSSEAVEEEPANKQINKD
ncbi:hypothetical protein [Colwellia sp. C1TZA3]|uniref:hypothetical protein n=1 Tax=Colwellia sp. C1TZA3 TaxID=2508879 RepID=UPI0011B9E7BB|nr:hypothetical protein [Colwellia sp. C1TZA3]TWX63347.1 hypothetical protein ESZ39_17020 [Colwellia sp. C1TZA3]